MFTPKGSENLDNAFPTTGRESEVQAPPLAEKGHQIPQRAAVTTVTTRAVHECSRERGHGAGGGVLSHVSSPGPKPRMASVRRHPTFLLSTTELRRDVTTGGGRGEGRRKRRASTTDFGAVCRERGHGLKDTGRKHSLLRQRNHEAASHGPESPRGRGSTVARGPPGYADRLERLKSTLGGAGTEG